MFILHKLKPRKLKSTDLIKRTKEIRIMKFAFLAELPENVLEDNNVDMKGFPGRSRVNDLRGHQLM